MFWSEFSSKNIGINMYKILVYIIAMVALHIKLNIFYKVEFYLYLVWMIQIRIRNNAGIIEIRIFIFDISYKSSS